jgi:hypothetical protein
MGIQRALVISISDYDNLENLDFCKSDGEDIYNLLKSIGYKIPEEYMLIGVRVEYSRLHDTIIEFFTDREVSNKDTLLFYYSGHGIPGINADEHYLASSEIDRRVPLLRGFSFEDLTRTRQMCNSKTIFTILDCCCSGADTITKGNDDMASKISQKIIIDKSRRRFGPDSTSMFHLGYS